MADNNRLELEITATDNTGPAAAKAKANFKSIDQQAAETAVSMSKSFDTASASVIRSLQTLEQRAALVGKSGVEKLVAQRQMLVDRAGSDEAAVNRIATAYDKLISAQQRLDRESATKRSGIAAGQATLPGEAGFQSALKAVQSRDSELRALEDRARRATLSRPAFLRDELNQALSQRGLTDEVRQRYRTSYAAMIKAAEEEAQHEGGHSQVLRRGILGVKDFLEGSTRGAIIEGTDILVGTSGGGGILQKAIPQIAEITGLSSTAVIAVGSLAAAFAGLGFAGIESARHLAETGEQINNFSLRSGIDPTRVQAFQFAAKAAGQDPNIVETLSRQ